MLEGLLLRESLKEFSVLNLLRVTRTETWQINNAAKYQPDIWTALSFEAEESQADALVEALSQSLNPEGWYINASTATDVYVIFPNKVFKYLKGDHAKREEAKRHGRTIGIPESQLDWSE